MGIFDNLHQKLDEALRAAHVEDANLLKAEDDPKASEEKKKKREKEVIARTALVDPNLTSYYGGAAYGLYRPRYSHISFKTLKEMSLRDPIIISIFQTRINQIAAFSRPQVTHYDTGFKIIPKDPSLDIQAGSPEEEEVEFLTNFIMNTGMVDEHRDPDDYMDFDTWLKLVVRDRLTYGAAAVETIRDQVGRMYSFLPVPTETVFYANKNVSDEQLDQTKVISKETYLPEAKRDEARKQLEMTKEEFKRGEYEYVQVIEGRVVEAFTRDQLLYKLGNPQNFIDNNGYCIGELEMATTTITSHLQANNYNKLFFTHGFAARGILHIKGDITPAQLQAFRAQWYAQVSGNANSWRTPILAGVDDIQWVQLSASNRDMEYTAYVDHIIRTLSAIFQISPMEFGFDYLMKGAGQQSLGESKNEYKIEESKDRGLRPILVWIESIINDHIIPGIDPALSEKYKFCFVGLDAESKQEELDRHGASVKLHTSLDDVRKEIGKDPILGGKMVLNPDYMQFMFKTHTVGEIREHLLGYKGDLNEPLFDYIPDPLYMQNRMEMSAPAQPIDPETGEPIPPELDENGQPIPPEVDENGQPIPPDEDGKEGPPQDGDKGDAKAEAALEQTVAAYIKEHPELVEKSLVKAADPDGLNQFHERLRTQYMKIYKDASAKMLAEILKEIKEDLNAERSDEDSDNDSEDTE